MTPPPQNPTPSLDPLFHNKFNAWFTFVGFININSSSQLFFLFFQHPTTDHVLDEDVVAECSFTAEPYEEIIQTQTGVLIHVQHA